MPFNKLFPTDEEKQQLALQEYADSLRLPVEIPPEAKASITDKLFGLNGQERYQLWPEKMVRSAATLPGDVMSGKEPIIDPATGHTSEHVIERAQDVAGMAGGTMFASPKGAVGAMGGKLIPVDHDPFAIAKPFYSAVEHAVTNNNQAKMTGDQWLGTLSNAKGVKPEELQWTGLTDFLAENKGKSVSKQEVQDHLNSNKVELKEVNKSLNRNQTIDDYEKNPIGITKYHDYQLPGGENYREMLLTLPPTKVKLDQYKVHRQDGHVDGTYADAESAAKRAEAIGGTVKQAETLDLNGGYKSSHWDEPNILAHVRMNDRTMPNEAGLKAYTEYRKELLDKYGRTEHDYDTHIINKGTEEELAKLKELSSKQKLKSLHLEEIQSDWHQQGREKGYNNLYAVKASEKKIKVQDADESIKKQLKDNGWNLDKIKDQDIYTYINNGYSLKEPATPEIMKEWISEGVPDAPFKKSWHELALKRMIREAAEKGYDRLSWTPGEAQAARYDLSKSIDHLEYNTKVKNIVAYDKNGNEVLNHRDISPEKLSDYVGKEAAEKLLNNPTKKNGEFHTLENADLKIGGEGMKGFYDQIIPKSIEKIGKEHGVKVQKGEIVSNSGKMGLTAKQAMEKAKEFYGNDAWNNMSIDDKWNAQMKIQDEGFLIKHPIHYIDVPQSLKDTAMKKGFPLFSGGVMYTPVDNDPWDKKK